MNSKRVMMVLTIIVAVVLATTLAVAQAPAGGQGGGAGRGGGAPGGAPGAPGGGAQGGRGGGGGRGPAGPSLTVTSAAWPDGGVVPEVNAGRGGNMSPAFEFSWVQAGAAAMPPANLVSYAVVLHDIENSSNRGTTDTLHWVLWDIPGTNKGLAGALPMGDLPDGTRQGTGIRGGAYFGPGAGPGPYHHYVFEFYALDTKLNLPVAATRAEIMAAMEGHVVGKAAYVG